MKYQFEVKDKQVQKAVNLKIAEPIYRDFKYAVKQQGLSMTEVFVEMMKQFAIDYKTRGQPKQVSFL